MDEILSIVNEDDEEVGSNSYSQIHKFGLLHRESYVYLINSKNHVLLQKRDDNGLWDHSAAGHFSFNESYLDGAKREFEEELGISIDSKELREVGYEVMNTVKPGKKNFRFVKVYLIIKDIALEEFIINKEEVKEVRFFDKKELSSLLEKPEVLTKSAYYFLKKHILKRIE